MLQAHGSEELHVMILFTNNVDNYFLIGLIQAVTQTTNA